MPRRRYNNQFGTITDNPLTSGATTMNSATFGALPAVVAPDYLAIVLDPDTASEEVIWVTAHTASATSATIWRAREGSTAVAHTSGAIWKHGPTAADIPDAQWITSPAGWNDAWLAAQQANAGSVLFFSSSFGQGAVNCTDVMSKAYIPLLRTDILSRPGITWRGDFYPVSYSVNWQAALAGTLPYVMDAVPVSWGYDGPGFAPRYTILNNGASPLFHFTTPANPSGAANAYPGSVVVWWFDPTGAAGNWAYNWDGGGNVNVAFAGSNTFKSTTIATPNSTGSHVLNFMTQPAASNLRVNGISCYPGTSGTGASGIFFNWWAWSGCPLHEFARSDKVPTDRLAQWWNGTAPEWDPDLIVFDMPNDAVYYPLPARAFGSNPTLVGYGYSPGMYHNKMHRLVSAMRASKPGGLLGNNLSFIQHLGSAPDGIYSDVTGNLTGVQNMDTYFELCYNAANTKNCAILNTNVAWGEFGFADGFQTVADPHPTDNGHIWIKNGMKLAGV